MLLCQPQIGCIVGGEAGLRGKQMNFANVDGQALQFQQSESSKLPGEFVGHVGMSALLDQTDVGDFVVQQLRGKQACATALLPDGFAFRLAENDRDQRRGVNDDCGHHAFRGQDSRLRFC